MRNLRRLFAAAIAAAIVPVSLLAQEAATITGRVTNAAGEPENAVAVRINSLNVGAATGVDGTYRLVVPGARFQAGQSVQLTASRVGLGSQTRTVTLTHGASLSQNFQLERDALMLETMVVTALGITQRERAIGSAVQSVTGDDLATARESNVVSALSGKISGVAVTNTGTQGGSARIVIRGANSISGENQPLFVVDGVPVINRSPRITGGTGAGGSQGSIDYGNTISDLNPNDIESVTVLKGANAAALYGSRAANGAIIVTTKSGRSGARGGGIGLTVSQNVTFDRVSRLPDYQNEFGQGSAGQFWYVNGRGGGINDGVDESWGPRLDGRLICQFTGIDKKTGECTPEPWIARPNNVRDFFETGRTLVTNVALASAGERSNVRLSLTNEDVEGMYPGLKLGRMSAALNGGAELTDRLSTTASVQYIRSEGQNRPGQAYQGTNPMQQFVWFGRQVDMAALRNYIDEDGEVFNWNHQYFSNPFFLAHENRNTDERNRVIGRATTSYSFTPWLTGTAGIGTDWYHDFRQRTYDHRNIGLSYAVQGGLWQQEFFEQETNADVLLSANHDLNSDVSVSVNAGANRRYGSYRHNFDGTNRLTVPGVYNIANSAGNPTTSTWFQERQVNSLLAHGQVGFRNYLFVDVTGRQDWSSTLPEGSNGYFYPSVSGSFVLSDAFMDAMPSAVSFAKLRASWARVGNDAGPYQIHPTFVADVAWDGTPSFALPTQFPAADLQPEETQSVEFGGDLRLFGDRLGLDLTYYRSQTVNQILPVQVSTTSGYNSRLVNAGKMSNRGIEAQVHLTPVDLSNGLRWDVTANYARNRNLVEELVEGSDALVLGAWWGLTTQARVGHPYGVLFGTPFRRDADGNVVVGANGLPLRGMCPEAARTCANPQMQVLGNHHPDWTGGLRNTLSYRNLDLSFLLDTKQGGSVFSVTQMFGTYAGVLPETLEGRGYDGEPMLVVPGVTVDGSPNTTGVMAQTYWGSLFQLHEPFVLDASFVKLREVTLGYSVPPTLTNRMGISAMNVALIGRNLGLWTNMPHIDPETAFDAHNGGQGLEFGSLPSPRSFGINVVVTP
jgi:TonB-linked SusC/RagA family outer membrane protein